MPIRRSPRRRPPPTDAGLAERLVGVAERILAEEGLEGVTLREVARRAGVTHGAPLRHYRGLATLLAEVAARGFRALSDAVDAAGAAVATGAGPEARLAAAARAYVRSAVANPARFALMFRPELLDAEHATLARESEASFAQLVRHVRAAQDAGWRTGHDTRRLAGALWAAVHGLATLWSQGAFQAAVPRTSLDEALAVTIDLALARPQNPSARRSLP
jgi:AcrR family transcriptional regulator